MRKILILTQIFLAFVLTDCKKGPDDPKISLLTRKARLCGKWNLSSGTSSLKVVQNSVAPTNLHIQNMDGTMATVYDDFNWTTYKIPYTLNLEIKKDGTFTMNENFGGNVLGANGTWEFAGGGKHKNKEKVFFNIESVSKGSTGVNLFNKECTEFTYEILRLKNKEIVLQAANDILIKANGDKIKFDGHFTLHQ
ncbi:MAG: hypothetical protein AB7O73_13850 [Bacteroidia bacterium]